MISGGNVNFCQKELLIKVSCYHVRLICHVANYTN